MSPAITVNLWGVELIHHLNVKVILDSFLYCFCQTSPPWILLIDMQIYVPPHKTAIEVANITSSQRIIWWDITLQPLIVAMVLAHNIIIMKSQHRTVPHITLLPLPPSFLPYLLQHHTSSHCCMHLSVRLQNHICPPILIPPTMLISKQQMFHLLHFWTEPSPTATLTGHGTMVM